MQSKGCRSSQDVCYCCLILNRTGIFGKPTLYKVSWTSIMSVPKLLHVVTQTGRHIKACRHTLKFLAAKTPKIYINKICVFFHKILCNFPYLNGYIPNRNKLRNTSATAQNTILYTYLNTWLLYNSIRF